MLSFLGLGITEPTPTWGNMIDNGRLVLREAPWLTVFPSMALVLTVIAFNLVGVGSVMPTPRELQHRFGQDRRGDQERAEDDDRIDAVRQDVAQEDAYGPRAGRARGLDVLALPHRRARPPA